MSRNEKCSAPQSQGHSIAQDSAFSIAPVIDAQVALIQLTSQCALAWINASMMVMATLSGAALSVTNDQEGEQTQFAETQESQNRIAAELAASGFAPMITGIEDTLHDEFFEPRPRRTTERELAALWERSNEFEPRLAGVIASDSRQEAA